jgi:hypothetical protein
MLAKKTVKNQITLPKSIDKKIPQTDYFEVSLRGEEIILKPVLIHAVGSKLERVRLENPGTLPLFLPAGLAPLSASGCRDGLEPISGREQTLTPLPLEAR